MTKHKIEVTPYSHGIYDGWNPDSKRLPELLKSTIKKYEQEFDKILSTLKAPNVTP